MLVLCLLLVARYWRDGARAPSPIDPPAAGLHRVVRVVDGDTIVIAPDSVVRLIGVDTPETVRPNYPVQPFGPEAAEFTRQFLSGGTARLTFDRERVDRFGRFLAYVWVGQQLLNEELLRCGLARFEPQFPYSETMKGRFRRAEDEARRARVGIWSVEPDGEQSRSGTRSRWEIPLDFSRDPLYCPLGRRRAATIELAHPSSNDRRHHHGPSQTHSGRLPHGHALFDHPGSGQSPRFL